MAGFFHKLWYGDAPRGTSDHSLEQIIDDVIAGRGTDAKALSVAAVFRARQMNADTIASVPVRVGDQLVPAPNRDQSAQEFLVEVVLALQDHGDAYISVDGNGDMRVLPDDAVDVSRDDKSGRRVYTNAGSSVRFRTDGLSRNLFVIAMNRKASDLKGLGPMENERIAGILAEQAYSEEYFKSHGKPSGVLKVPSEPTSAEAKIIKAQWDAARTVRSTAIISQQMDYTATSFSPDDSEWTQTHLIGIGDISTLFGVPAFFLNYSPAGSSLVYQNIGSIYEGYWRNTLFPTYVKRIQDVWSAVIGQPVVFDPEALFLSSLKDRATAAWQLTSMGFDPAAVLDGVGLPPIAHTGETPTTLYDESTSVTP